MKTFMYKTTTFLSIFLLNITILSLSIFADNNLTFRHIQPKDGLSQSTVRAIVQDQLGNIWFGTQNGLNKFDGSNFTQYFSDINDEKTIGDNSIYALFISSNGDLWIGTETVLSKYVFKEDRFYNYEIPRHQHNIISLNEYDGKIVICCDTGLYFYDINEHKITQNKELKNYFIRDVLPLKNCLIVGTKNGIFKLNKKKNQDEDDFVELSKFKKYDISKIGSDKENGFWIGTHGHGLIYADSKFNIINHFTSKNSNLPSDYIRTLDSDNYGNLWIGTYDGLGIYFKSKKKLEQYKHNINKNSLSHNSIWSICTDNQNGVWLGTYFGGVNYYNPRNEIFETISLSEISKVPVYGFISCFTEINDNIWIGTNDDGLFLLNTKSDNVTSFNLSKFYNINKKPISKNIKCIFPDKEQHIYIGTHLGGLYLIDLNKKTIENFTINNRFPIQNGCYSILDDNDKLWIGAPSGLYIFDKKTKKISLHPANNLEPRLHSSLVKCLFKDSKNKIWIGTDFGIYCYDNERNHISNFDDTEAHQKYKYLNINDIYEDSMGYIWICANKGLFKYDSKENTFNEAKLPGETNNLQTISILEDKFNNLWITTDNGLLTFDRDHDKFKKYRTSTENKENSYIDHSKCIAKDGTFYFGGLSGLTRFKPLNVSSNPYSPKPYVSNVSVLNVKGKKKAEYQISRNNMGGITNLKISSAAHAFTICFAVANPLAFGKNTFYYKTEGFNNQWYKTNNTEINYSRMKPGKYVLHIKSENNDGLESAEETLVNIEILPRWWETLFARIIFTLIILSAILAIFLYYKKRLAIQMELEMKIMENENIRKMSQKKIEFFINLSHLLRTPLTLILSPLKEVEKRNTMDKFIKDRMNIIKKSSLKLMHIVNQMLTYWKAEQGLIKLKIKDTPIEEVASSCFSIFEDEAENRHMDYTFFSHINNEKYPMDKGVLELILVHLLGTAFKNANNDNAISLNIFTKEVLEDKFLVFEIIYNEKEDKSIQQDFTNEINKDSIGLALVDKLCFLLHGKIECHKDSSSNNVFSISFPTNINAYKDIIHASKTLSSGIDTDNSEIIPYIIKDATSKKIDNSIEEQDNRYKLLIFIKDHDFRNYIIKSLNNKYSIEFSNTHKEILERLKDYEPDIIIADNSYDEIGGMKLCENIKRNIRTSHIPFILLTTKDDLEAKLTHIEAGADAVLTQPLSIELLQATISNTIKTRERMKHKYSSEKDIDPNAITVNSLDGEFLEKAIQVVNENIDNEKFTSSVFAEKMCMSRSNLYLKITSITGDSAAQFIRKIRFNKACELLQLRKYSIAEVSHMVGFNSPSYFATSFKKHVGCLPTEYIKS